MSARKLLVGCAASAGLILLLVVIGGVVAFRHLTAPVPLPSPATLADADSVGLAVVRLEPDDPWVRGMFDQMSKYSTNEPATSDLFPVEMIWTARRPGRGTESYTLSLSFSPRGRFLGLMSDFALWRAGRSASGKVSRVEHRGEGISSFPGTPFKGYVFVRGNTVVWTSDLDTARQAVDLVVAAEQTEAVPDAAAAVPPVMALVPEGSGHTLAGAVTGADGTLSRSLALLPGGEAGVPEEALLGVSVSFFLDTASADEAFGEAVLRFSEGTPPERVQAAASTLASRLSSVRLGKARLEASPLLEPGRAALSLKVSGLTSIYGQLLEEAVRMQKTLRAAGGGEDGPRQDPNQSSSTFQ